MKVFLLISFLALISFTSIAQDKQTKEKLTSEEKKELKRIESEKQTALITSTIESKRYVLEAQNIRDRRGNTYPVSSNINFVAVDSTRAVFQLGSAQTIGINGLGGVTIDGRIASYDVQKQEKNGSYYIKINISATGGFYEITLSIMAGGNATAQIMTLKGDRFEYTGNIVPAGTSRVFKGFSY